MIRAATANRSGRPIAHASPISPPDSLAGQASSFAAPTGPARRPDSRTGTHLPRYWSADGTWLAYADFGDRGISIATVSAVMAVDVEGDHTPRKLIKGSAGRISPTERWIAVPSTTTGTTKSTCCRFPIPREGAGAFPPTAARTRHGRLTARRCSIVAGRRSWPWPLMVTIRRYGRSRRKLFEGPYLFDSGPTHFDAASRRSPADGQDRHRRRRTARRGDSSSCRTGSRSCGGLHRGSKRERLSRERVVAFQPIARVFAHPTTRSPSANVPRSSARHPVESAPRRRIRRGSATRRSTSHGPSASTTEPPLASGGISGRVCGSRGGSRQAWWKSRQRRDSWGHTRAWFCTQSGQSVDQAIGPLAEFRYDLGGRHESEGIAGEPSSMRSFEMG